MNSLQLKTHKNARKSLKSLYNVDQKWRWWLAEILIKAVALGQCWLFFGAARPMAVVNFRVKLNGLDQCSIMLVLPLPIPNRIHDQACRRLTDLAKHHYV